MRTLARVLPLVWLAPLLCSSAVASPWVYRPMNLPRSDFSLDLGLGVGHRPEGDTTGLGVNLEMAAGLTSFIQLGVRTGLRLGHDGRATQADAYGRMFDTETWGTDGQPVANPEVSLRWLVVPGSAAELGLEARVVLPAEDGTDLTLMPALPLALHIGGAARIDTGLYIPITFHHDTVVTVSIPIHVWFQITSSTFLGPLTGVRFHDHGGGTTVPLGFGLGHALAHNVDLKTWLLFPDVNHSGSAKSFGGGIGLQVRF